jgi:hypothetical protein
LYIGALFIGSALPASICAIPARISGYHPSRWKAVETSTNFLTTSGWANDDAQDDAATDRVTHYVGLLVPQILDQRRDVVCHPVVVEQAVDIRGALVGFQIDGNHLPVLQERRQDLVEHFGSSRPAVQQDQRFSSTVDFVIEIEAVYRSVPGFEGNPTAPVNSVKVSRLFPTRQIQALKPRTLGANEQ